MFSHSKIATYEQCPKRYEFRYVQKLKAETESVEGFLGRRVHEALDRLYDLARSGRLLTEEELVGGYETEWDRHWNSAVHVVKANLRPEHYRVVGRKCLTDYYRRFCPFDQHIVIATERRIVVPLDPERRYKLVGFIDRIDKLGDGAFAIVDYKTSGTLPSQEEKDADRQLALYQIGLRDTLPNIKDVQLVWHYLRFDTDIKSQRTAEELEQLRLAMIAKIQEIEAAESAGTFPANVSNLCDWCEFKAICPQWRHEHETAQLAPVQYRLDEGVALVNRLVEVTAERRELRHLDDQLTGKIQEIEQALIKYGQQHGVCRVFGSDRVATVTPKSEWQIPTKGETPAAYAAMITRLKASPLWSELTAFSRTHLIRVLDTLDGERLLPLIGDLVRKHATCDVLLRKWRGDD